MSERFSNAWPFYKLRRKVDGGIDSCKKWENNVPGLLVYIPWNDHIFFMEFSKDGMDGRPAREHPLATSDGGGLTRLHQFSGGITEDRTSNGWYVYPDNEAGRARLEADRQQARIDRAEEHGKYRDWEQKVAEEHKAEYGPSSDDWFFPPSRCCLEGVLFFT